MAFDVNITGSNAPVKAGSTLDVDYSVENTGSSQETQTIALNTRRSLDVSGVVTDFEGGQLSNTWETVQDAALDETNVYHGSQSVLFSGGNSTSSLIGVSDADAFRTPRRGDRFGINALTAASGGGTDDVRIEAKFFAADTDNQYILRWDVQNESLALVNESGGTESTLDSGSVGTSYSSNTWWRLEVESYIDSDRIVGRVRDDTGAVVTELSARDDEHAGRGLRLAEPGDGNDVWLDLFTYTAELLEPGTTVLEDFEGSSPLSAYSGSTSSWTVVEKPTLHDLNAIQLGSDNQHIYDTGRSSPAKGDAFDAWVYSSRGHDISSTQVAFLTFGHEDSNDYYRLKVYFDNTNAVELSEVSAGSESTLDNFGTNGLDQRRWYRIHIEWDDGTLGGSDNDIRYALYDRYGVEIGSSSVNDSTHATGSGLGFDGNVHTTANETITFDRVTTEGTGYDIIDVLEDEDISEYAGDTADFTTSRQDFAIYGDHVLEATNTGSGSFRTINASMGSLAVFPQRGDTFAAYVRPTDVTATKSRFDIFFGTNGVPDGSADEYYQVRGRFASEDFEIDGDSSIGSSFVSMDAGPTSDDWYEVLIEWGDPTITATLTRLTDNCVIARTSLDDTSYDHGGFGWGSELNGSVMYYDAAHLSGFYQGDPLLIVDDFEDGDLSEYENTSTASVTTSTVESGTYALELPSDSGMVNANPGGGLDNFPQADDTWEFWFHPNSSTDSCYFKFFRDDDALTWYGILLDVDDGDFEVRDDSFVSLAKDSSATYNTGEWNRVVVDWASSGDFTLTLYDNTGTQNAQITGTDTQYTSGGIAFDPSSMSSTWYFDEVIITNRP